MAYFAGTPDGAGKAHDDKAKAIAGQARKFTEERMRWEDMQSYTLLLMLEVCLPPRNQSIGRKSLILGFRTVEPNVQR